MNDTFETRQHQIKKPFEIREKIQELLKLENEIEMTEGIRGAVIGGFNKHIMNALGYRDLVTGKYDYSKPAKEKSQFVRRLVFGWLLLSDDHLLKPVSGSDREIIDPLAINAVSRWMSYEDCGNFVQRPTFTDELLQVIYCAQFDYEKIMKSGFPYVMIDLVDDWKKEYSLNDIGPAIATHFDLADFRENFVSVRGPQMLQNALVNYQEKMESEFIPETDLSNDDAKVLETPESDLSDLDELFW